MVLCTKRQDMLHSPSSAPGALLRGTYGASQFCSGPSLLYIHPDSDLRSIARRPVKHDRPLRPHGSCSAAGAAATESASAGSAAALRAVSVGPEQYRHDRFSGTGPDSGTRKRRLRLSDAGATADCHLCGSSVRCECVCRAAPSAGRAYPPAYACRPADYYVLDTSSAGVSRRLSCRRGRGSAPAERMASWNSRISNRGCDCSFPLSLQK